MFNIYTYINEQRLPKPYCQIYKKSISEYRCLIRQRREDYKEGIKREKRVI